MIDVAWVLIAGGVIGIAALPGLAALWVYVRALERRIDDHEALRLLDAAERARQSHEILELRHGMAILIAQLRRANMTPEWTPAAAVPPAMSRQQAQTDRMVLLWQRIEDQFDLEEQAELWFTMGWGNDIHGETAGERARALVAYANRRGKLDALIELCRKERLEGGF